jgi:hypothetical protein
MLAHAARGLRARGMNSVLPFLDEEGNPVDVRYRAPMIAGVLAVSATLVIMASIHQIPAKGASSAGSADISHCNKGEACLAERNAGNGDGILASSVKGFGIMAISRQSSGILGETFDDTSVHFNEGAGVYGADESTDLAGGNDGVWGTTTYGVGVLGTTDNPSSQTQFGSVGVVGIDQSEDFGLLNVGVQGISSGVGILGVELSRPQPSGQPQYPAIEAVCSGGALAMSADNGYGSPGGDVMSLDCSGNMILTGTVVSNGVPLIGVRPPGQRPRAAYAALEAQPAIEDVGEGQVVNGSGHVEIDPSFSLSMDASSGYSVFVTPEGPSLGLYVTGKTRFGFDVRENPGGHSTLAFSYRIVGTPSGAREPRLPDEAEAVAALYREAISAPHSRASASAMLAKVRKRG